MSDPSACMNRESNLVSYAARSTATKGRKHEQEVDDLRLPFQRDKDRIIHCKAFRRLDGKTQVFIAGSGDHFRTRLTHTLEVAQIGRDIARRMCLNEDLCEAIALAHDLGHPPFGHGGEEALNEIMQEAGLKFEHNEQSRRIVEKLEKSYPYYDGLNLTYEVLDGLIKHQSAFDQADMEFEVSAHLEAQVVNISDEIAYINHDIDDGLRSGILKISDFNDFELWKLAKERVFEKYGNDVTAEVFISRIVSHIISLMIEDFCSQTAKNVREYGIESIEDIMAEKNPIGQFSSDMAGKIREVRKFLYDRLYMGPEVTKFISEGQTMIRELFEYYMSVPEEIIDLVPEDKKERMILVKDYIAGMTDRFLQNEHGKLVGKKSKL